MATHKIAVIAGDGIGPEVIAEGIKVLDEVARLDGRFRFEFTHFPWGCEYYKETGRTAIPWPVCVVSRWTSSSATTFGTTAPRKRPNSCVPPAKTNSSTPPLGWRFWISARPARRSFNAGSPVRGTVTALR